MNDIVERLCLLPLMHSLPGGVTDVTSDAATEITRLREQVKVLEDALSDIASWDEGPVVGGHFDEPASAAMARAALEQKP